MAYIGNNPDSILQGRKALYTITATANQTAFSGLDDNGNTIDLLQAESNHVYLNGSRLVDTADFTLNGDVLTLTSGAASGDIMVITTEQEMGHASSYTKAAADSRYINYDGDIVNGTIQMGGGPGNNITFTDNNKIVMGTGNDLEIYHSGTNSYIDDVGEGSLFLRSGTTYIQNAAGTKTSIVTNAGAGQTLYHNNTPVFVTTATGIDVTGNVVVSGTVDGRDVATDGTKLDTVETSADVTDATNVAAAGALMTTGGTMTGTLTANTLTSPKIETTEALPTVRPSLLLDFENSKTLDPRITFARASIGTYWDGKSMAKAEENQVRYSQAITTANGRWADGAMGTLTVNAGTAPDGTTTASTWVPNAGTGGRYFYTNNLPASSDRIERLHVHSIYMKANGYNFGMLMSYDADGSGYDYVIVDLTDGSIDASGGNDGGDSLLRFSSVSVGNGWYRVQIACTSQFSYLSCGCTNSASGHSGGVPSFTADGTSGIYVWGAQAELDRAYASQYTPTTDTIIVKYQPKIKTASRHTPRFDHDPITGESKGLLIEEARTNLVTHSVDFSAGHSNNSLLIAGKAVAPDGTLTASVMQNVTDNGYNYTRISGLQLTQNVTYTYSVFAKAAGTFATAHIWLLGNVSGDTFSFFNLNDGTSGHKSNSAVTSKIQDVGNGWYRCSITFTNTAATGSQEIGVGLAQSNSSAASSSAGKQVYLWGEQLEVGSFATSFIPTSGGTVTRAADRAQIIGENFNSWFNQSSGTFYTEHQSAYGNNNHFVYQVSAGNNASGVIDQLRSRFRISPDNQNYADINSGTIVSGTFHKIASSYAENDFAASLDGASVVVDTSGQLDGQADRITIGDRSVSNSKLNGHIKKLAFFPQRLSNATLQAMTEE